MNLLPFGCGAQRLTPSWALRASGGLVNSGSRQVCGASRKMKQTPLLSARQDAQDASGWSGSRQEGGL